MLTLDKTHRLNVKIERVACSLKRLGVNVFSFPLGKKGGREARTSKPAIARQDAVACGSDAEDEKPVG
jgi:hypothetical protein